MWWSRRTIHLWLGASCQQKIFNQIALQGAVFCWTKSNFSTLRLTRKQPETKKKEFLMPFYCWTKIQITRSWPKSKQNMVVDPKLFLRKLLKSFRPSQLVESTVRRRAFGESQISFFCFCRNLVNHFNLSNEQIQMFVNYLFRTPEDIRQNLISNSSLRRRCKIQSRNVFLPLPENFV